MAPTFEEQIMPHYDTYIKLATRMCFGDVHKAEDMVQEAMVKALVHFNEFDNSFKITTWFSRILRNTILDAQKMDTRVKERCYDYFMWKGSFDPFYMIEEDRPYEECLDVLPDMIEALPLSDQIILKMYMNGDKQQEIGKTLGITRGAAAQRIRRICKQLREELVGKTC